MAVYACELLTSRGINKKQDDVFKFSDECDISTTLTIQLKIYLFYKDKKGSVFFFYTERTITHLSKNLQPT